VIGFPQSARRCLGFGPLGVGLFTLAVLMAAPRSQAAPVDQSALPVGAAIGDYVGEDVMIPMRDGVKLHAEVWRPKGVDAKLPILMQRSPYGYNLAKVTHSFDAEYKELGREGFIFVLEDIRGRFGSQGDFVMLRPKAKTSGGIDESTDTYDSIDWLTKSVPNNNGKVGIFGVSYLGWTTAMATINPHPALKALSVQAAPEDMFLGDDFHHNGAFRLDYGWEYAAALETDGRTFKAFSFGKDDPYAWFLKQKDIAALDKQNLGAVLPTWRNFVEHPNYDAFWRAGVTSAEMPPEVKIPNLIVAGWWDQEDFYGPLKIYKHQENGDAHNRNFLVIGPWNHGGWVRGAGDHYGPFDLGSETSVYFREQVEVPWFKHWLKDEGALDQPEALVFETGSNQWRRYAAWPPKAGVSKARLYFHAGGRLSFDPPTAADQAPDRFVSDPADPVPYRPRPISAMSADKSTWPLWLADDQATFAKRHDVLSWRTGVLDHDVTLRGDVIAKLYASTTGRDADWVVKLIDIYPSDAATPEAERGRQLIISDEVFRGRFRKSFEHPEPLTPGKVLDYSIDLHTASHVFKAGHEIAVQVQSTWFPLIDRNPQTYTVNIFKAPPEAFKAQTHKVFHTPAYPSAIAVDVATETAPVAR
jgi:putative CocE/NonD family hydrolase